MNRIMICAALLFMPAAAMTVSGEAEKQRRDTPEEDLIEASRTNNMGIVQAAIARGANINTQDDAILGKTPLSYAAARNNIALVQWLLRHGANVNLADISHRTPLIVALENDSDSTLIQELIQHGANVNCAEINGFTPLHDAVRRDRIDIVQLLIESGARVNNTSNSGWTPLFSAAMYGHTDITQLFIDRGADINRATNDNGTTPLHIAAAHGHIATVRILIENGADLYRTDRKGRTAAHVAREMSRMPHAGQYEEYYREKRERCREIGEYFDSIKKRLTRIKGIPI